MSRGIWLRAAGFIICGGSFLGAMDELNPMVVVESRMPVALDEASPWVTRISGEELDARQVYDLSEALRQVPGMAVARAGQAGAQTSLFSRGSNSDQTTFLLNGRKLNGGFSKTYNLGQLSSSGFSSVEILRGASSVQYGAEGIGGAVQLRTAGVSERAESARVEGGSFGTYRVETKSSLMENDFGADFNFAYLETDNQRANAEYDNFSGNLNLQGKLNEEWEWEFLGFAYRSEMGLPGPVSNPSATDYQKNLHYLFSPGISTQGESWSFKSFYSRSFERVTSPWGRQDLRGDQIETLWNSRILDELDLTLGMNLQMEEYEDKESKVSEKVNDWAHFLLVSMSLSERSILSAGLRREEYSTFGSEWTHSVSASRQLSDSTSLFGRVSRSFSPPTALDSFGWSGANPDLLPEQSKSLELGLRWRNQSSSLEICAFQNHYDHLIVFFDPDNDWIGEMQNVEKAKARGIEASITEKISKRLEARATYTYLDAREEGGSRLVRRPRHTGSCGFHWREKEYQTGFETSLAADRMDSSYERGEDYAVCRLYGRKSFGRGLRLHARLENLFDEKYEEIKGYPALGRAIHMGFEYTF